MVSSCTRVNTRYRGPTSGEDTVNCINEILHDIKFLYYKCFGDNKNIVGYDNIIKNDLSYAIDGEHNAYLSIVNNNTNIQTMHTSLNTQNAYVDNMVKELIEWTL